MRAARRQRHPPFAFGLARSGEDPLCDNFRSPISGQLGISPRMLPEGGRVGQLSASLSVFHPATAMAVSPRAEPKRAHPGVLNPSRKPVPAAAARDTLATACLRVPERSHRGG